MVKKIITILLLIVCLICSTNFVYGAKPNSDILQTGKEFIELGKEQQNSTNLTEAKSGFNDLAGILWGAGIFIVIIIGTFLGIKYMFASLEEKASIKQTFIPYAIGSTIILGALGIWKFAVELLEGLV